MDRSTKKRIVVSVTTDLVADNRVHKVCKSLTNMGFDVLLVGRKRRHSLRLQSREYATKRFKLIFEKGFFFYLEYNVRLFCFLLFRNSDILLSNDLDTLPANFIVSKLKNKPLIYDSHELFTESPELINRPKVQKFWEQIENRLLPKIENAYTVCNSIANYYLEKYNVPFKVVRNVPEAKSISVQKKEPKKNAEKIILYQGAVNIGRGLEQVIRAMKFIEKAKLIIAGDGYLRPELERLVLQENLSGKVKFNGMLPFEELSKLTPQADLGLSIEEDLGLNYHFALPNKLFDYIQAEVPVLVTKLPEMVAVVEKYKIGKIVDSTEPEKLAATVNKILFDTELLNEWNSNLKRASKELTWEKEEKVLLEIFGQFL